MYNPVILSETIKADTVIEIPSNGNKSEKVNQYLIHMYVEKGEVSVKYNSLDNNPPLLLYSGGRWNVRFYEGQIKSVIIKFINDKGPKKMWVIVEKK